MMIAQFIFETVADILLACILVVIFSTIVYIIINPPEKKL